MNDYVPAGTPMDDLDVGDRERDAEGEREVQVVGGRRRLTVGKTQAGSGRAGIEVAVEGGVPDVQQRPGEEDGGDPDHLDRLLEIRPYVLVEHVARGGQPDQAGHDDQQETEPALEIEPPARVL